MKKIILSIALLIALPTSALAAFKPATLTNGINKIAVYSQEQANYYFGKGYAVEKKLGANSGPEHYSLEYFIGGLVEGGGLTTFTATSTQSAKTMPISWLNSSQIDIAAVNGVALSLTTPSTSSLATILPRVSSEKRIYLRNLNTTVASSTTIVAATGVDLRMGEETGADVIINGLNNAYLIFKRVSANDFVCLVREDVVGD